MTLPRFGIAGHALLGILAALDKHRDEMARISSVSHRGSGTTSYIRFEPSRVTQWVQFHVQHDGAGGGGATYNSATNVSSTEIDCRSTRIQDQTVTRNGVDHYYVWIIPKVEDGGGTRHLMDGESGRPDYMTYVDLGI